MRTVCGGALTRWRALFVCVRSFSLLTGDFKKGEQVLISYGPQARFA
jgi:hypothetical protein